MILRVLKILEGTSVDGPGLRTSVYFAGCEHHCFNCHNPQSWDPKSGTEMTIPQIMERITENDFNVTFSGGDPLFQLNGIIELAKEIKKSGKNIWCYTGYTYEQIVQNPLYQNLLSFIDVLVDGKYDNKLRNTELRFRGSENQRIIDIKNSAIDNIVLWK